MIDVNNVIDLNKMSTHASVQKPGRRSKHSAMLATYEQGVSPICVVFSFAQTKSESSPIISAWVRLMPYVFDWIDYVRCGCVRNSYCDSGDCMARAQGMTDGKLLLHSG